MKRPDILDTCWQEEILTEYMQLLLGEERLTLFDTIRNALAHYGQRAIYADIVEIMNYLDAYGILLLYEVYCEEKYLLYSTKYESIFKKLYPKLNISITYNANPITE